MIQHKNRLQNQDGSIVITTMVIISIVLVIFSGIVTLKLTELSKQSFKVNEAYRYLNVMEEMGMLVARARELGRNGGGTCPAGTFIETVDTNKHFCLPSYNGTGNLNTACVTDASQLDRSGNPIRYCLQAATGLDTTAALGDGSDKSNVAELNFKIVPVKTPSMIEKVFFAMVTPLNSAHAACDNLQNWWEPCTPDNNAATIYDGVVNEPSIAPVAYTTAPTGTGSSSGPGYAGRANLETFAPTLATWAVTGTNNANEIFTPSCDVSEPTLSNQYWLGCMSCSDPNVLCVDMQMCPPVYGTGTAACAQPYRQRIAIYPDGTL